MCPLGEQLRLAWYRVSIIVNGDIDEREKIEANRGQPEYMQAKQAFVQHIENCPECKTTFHQTMQPRTG